MGRNLLFLILSFFTYLAHAEMRIQAIDQRFSFEGAQQAFRSARAPTFAEINGEWMNVGVANIPGVNPNDNGYYPDGRYPIAGQPGYFYWIWNYRDKGMDSFGSPLLTLDIKVVGAETGKVYREETYGNLRMTSSGIKFFVRGTRSTCDIDVECRFVQKVGMILCESAINNASRDCAEQTGKITGYVGLIRRLVTADDVKPEPTPKPE